MGSWLLTLALNTLVPSGEDAIVESPAELQAALAERDGPRLIRVAPGVFSGRWTIRRALHLVGSVGTVLEGDGSGSVLDVDGSDVVVENFVIRRSGRKHTSEDAGIKARGERIVIRDVVVTDTLFGITLEQCKRCIVERATVLGTSGEEIQGDAIKLWEAHGSSVSDSFVEHSRDIVVWYSRGVRMAGNRVRHSRYGTHFMYAHDVDVTDGVFSGNVVGVFVMYSDNIRISRTLLGGAKGAAGMGLGLKESEHITVVGSAIVANTTGIYFDRSPRVETEPVRLQGSLVGLNAVGLRLHSSQRGVEIYDNDFVHNTHAIEVEGGGDALAVSVRSNHWSDYEGFDLDGNAVGDVPFEEKALSRSWTHEEPTLAFFSEGVAMRALDMVAQAVPLFAARLLLSDPAPRMRVAHGRTAP